MKKKTENKKNKKMYLSVKVLSNKEMFSEKCRYVVNVFHYSKSYSDISIKSLLR